MAVQRTQLGLVAYVAARDGSFVPIRLARNEGPRPPVLVAPRAGCGARRQARRVPARAAAEAGGARRRLGRSGGRHRRARAAARGRPGADRLPRLARHGRRRPPDAPRRALRFHVTLTNEVDTYLRPRQPTDGLQIPAVVSPFLATLAGPDRVLGVTVNGDQLSFRVAAVARRFPGIPQNVTSDFLVVDRPALESALNTSAPGTGFATELWLDTDASHRKAVEARLRKPPFTALAVASRSRLEHSLQAEPVARAALAMLETAALTAIVLALLGLVLGTLSERRDEAAELFDLEAQGVAPAGLRRQLRLRASLAGLAGAIGGIATGVVLSLLVVRFVELTANATSPEPPLELVLDWPLLAVAGLVAAARGRRCSSAPRPGAPSARRVPARYGGAA